MSPESLREFSRKQLEHLARSKGVPNIRQLRKQDLIHALASKGSLPSHKSGASRLPKSAASSRPQKSPQSTSPAWRSARDEGDEIQIDVFDSCWLRVSWRIGAASRDRAVAALGPEWHLSTAVLRMEDATPEEEHERAARSIDQPLPAGSHVWFLRVADIDRTYRLALGYRGPGGRWYQIIRSRPFVPSRLRSINGDQHKTASNGEPGFPKLAAPATDSTVRTRQGAVNKSAENRTAHQRMFLSPGDAGAPRLEVELELIVRGCTSSEAHVALDGRPMTVDAAGGFHHQLPLAAGRQVLPVVATSADGGGERTMILAFDINTRELEPRVFDEGH